MDNNLLNLTLTRRSTRQFTDEYIEDNIIKEILNKEHITYSNLTKATSGFTNVVYFIDNKFVIKMSNDENIIKKLPAGISKNAEIVYNIMSDGVNELDEIKRKTQLEVRHILVALTELEILGFAEAYAPNCYRIKPT